MNICDIVLFFIQRIPRYQVASRRCRYWKQLNQDLQVKISSLALHSTLATKVQHLSSKFYAYKLVGEKWPVTISILFQDFAKTNTQFCQKLLIVHSPPKCTASTSLTPQRVWTSLPVGETSILILLSLICFLFQCLLLVKGLKIRSLNCDW